MFDFFDFLKMLGGLCLFLFGMNVMGDGLERRAGGSLKALLSRLTTNKFAGFLTGLGVTAVIQSSSATTVMVVGFVNSRLMTLRQAIGVIMGANIGTTVTSWILSLGGISSDNVVLRLMKPSSFSPILALIGIILLMSSRSAKRKDVGYILLGFATFMIGMDTMSGAVKGLADVPEFQNLFLLFKNPVLGVLVGALVTAIIQSSSASVGILQALSATGAISYATAIPIIMGQNIGTCVTALLSSFGANKNAKRAAVVHLAFNIVGTVLCLSVFSLVSYIFSPAILGERASYLGIAICHTIFNVLCTLILMPATALLEKVAYLVVPDGKAAEKAVTLDERLLATPSVAIMQSKELAVRMGERAAEGFRLVVCSFDSYTPERAAAIREIEDEGDKYEDVIGSFLTALTKRQVSEEDSTTITELLKVIGDFERISDHNVNLLESIEEMREKGISLSDKAREELAVLCTAVLESVTLAITAFKGDNYTVALGVEPLEEVIDELKRLLRDRHIERLAHEECTIEGGFIWSDMLTDLERIGDHCSNVAVCVMDAAENTMDVHESLRLLKNGNGEFKDKYEVYARKYSI